jgi:serine protease AprX
MSRVWMRALAVAETATCMLVLTGASVPSESPSDAALAKLAPGTRVELHNSKVCQFVVQLKEPVSDRDLAALRHAGARITRRYGTLPMAGISAPGTALARLAEHPAVKRISPDLQVQRTLEFAAPAVGADIARTQYGFTGKGVGVAVVDSGIYPAQDLGTYSTGSPGPSRIVAGYDFVNNVAVVSNNDSCGHGSNVAGIVAGNGFASNYKLSTKQYCTRNFTGVATQANLINLRVLDAYGRGTVSNALAAIDWCIQRKAQYNIRVMNLSLGHAPGESYLTDPLSQAAERAWKAGILVVCAAGNRGRKVSSDANSGVAYGTINSPGNNPYVLTVGSVNDSQSAGRSDDAVSTYSSRGPSRLDHILKPDLVAPGNRIIAIRHNASYLETQLAPQNLVPLSYYWTSPPRMAQAYYKLSGTSMAAAVVSGAGALLLQKDPTLTPDDVKARLMKTAHKVWHGSGLTPDIYSRGAGYLNIPGALNSTDRVAAAALSPTVVNTGGTIEIQNAIWGDSALWGDNAIWGDSAI